MADIELRVLGSGDAFGDGGRLQTCIWLRTGHYQALLDCGATSLVAMKRFGIEPNEIDAVLISHFHGDHFGGLPYLILDGQFRGRTRPLAIGGPPHVQEHVRAHLEATFPGASRTHQRFPLSFEVLSATGVRLGPLRVSALPVAHTPGSEALGLRVEAASRTVAYSGDTEWTPALVELSAGADLFVCEAYSYDKRVPYHLDYRTLEQHASALTAAGLLLTHLGPEMLVPHELRFPLASDGLRVPL